MTGQTWSQMSQHYTLQAIDSILQAIDSILQAIDSILQAIDSILQAIDSIWQAIDSILWDIKSIRSLTPIISQATVFMQNKRSTCVPNASS